MKYKIKKGQYFYSWSGMYKCYRIYKSSRDIDDIRYSCGGSIAFGEKDYDTREEARQRVKELNGWI